MTTFTRPRLVADGGVLLAATDQSIALDNLAFELTVRTLEGRSNQLSAAHKNALLHPSIILGLLAKGSVQGRYVFELPAGLGKTTLLVCWTKAVMALGLDWSIAICASRVEELTEIRKELTSGELPVPEDEIGLWHAKEDAAVPPTFTRRDADRYGSKRILLLTHSRMQKGQEVARWLQYKGQPRNLVVYDESLSTTALWEASYAGVVGDIKKVWAAAGQEGLVAAFLKQLMDDLDQEVFAQKGGAAPKRLRLLPTDDPELLREVQRLVRRRLGPDGELESFLRNAEADVRAVVAKNDGSNATLIRTYTTVPDELDRMLVLDASFPIRTLLQLGNERIQESARSLQLKTVQETWPWVDPQFKR